jgi:hypothetical protein
MNNTGSGTQSTAIQAARSAGVPVFTIGFGGVDQFVLSEIARQTGGRFFLGASSADLQAILRAIGQTLDNQYLLSWTTKFISGGTEQVEVRVEDSGQSDQEKTSYSQAGTGGCPRPVVGCTVRVDSPKQKDVWLKGTRQTLRWSTSGASCGPAVGLGLSDGSAIFYLGDVEDSGSKTYNIDFLPAGTNYQAIVVNRSSQAGFTGFSGTFEIRVPKALPVCRSGPEVLCLGKGRFLLRALWRTPDGKGGFGKTIPLTTDSGAFWFFDSANAELFVKVLDGQALNSHLWVLTAALTDLQYTLFVTDTTTGQTRVYGNQPGEFVSFADVTAFGPPLESSDDGPPADAGAEPDTEEEEVAPPPALPASTTPLWIQLDSPGRLVISSEDRLEPGGDPRDTEAADDFVVPAKTSWSIDGVDVQGAYFGNGPRGPAASVSVVIYADKQGKPGAVQCSNLGLQPRAGRASGAFEIDLPKPCKLGAGRFWLAVRAGINFTTAGQWGWSERASQREKPSVWRNPGNGYSTACRSFGPRLASCKVGEAPDLLFRLRGQVVSGGSGGGSCKSNATTLCLGGKRFKVEVSFKNTPTGKPAAARAVLHSATTGYFWFFNAANPEVAVKILDGRAFNGKFWVFYGGLTDREFTLKVTDTVTGATKTYSNRAGRFVSAGDIEALPGS